MSVTVAAHVRVDTICGCAIASHISTDVTRVGGWEAFAEGCIRLGFERGERPETGQQLIFLCADGAYESGRYAYTREDKLVIVRPEGDDLTDCDCDEVREAVCTFLDAVRDIDPPSWFSRFIKRLHAKSR